MPIERWIIAPEYDEVALRRLGAALRHMGFSVQDHWNALAGSQDIFHWELASEAGALTIESETYIGLWAEGPPEIVQQLRETFASEPSQT